MGRLLSVYFSDTHAGHKLGLMSPKTILREEDEHGDWYPYTPKLNRVQEYLWDRYTSDISKIRLLAGNDKIVVNQGGDACHGHKYPEQLISTRISDHVTIAATNLAPWYQFPNLWELNICIGTGAHNLGEASIERLLANQLQAAYPDISLNLYAHAATDVGGVLVDHAHHGTSAGIRSWTKGNVLRLYVKDILMQSLMDGIEPPRIVIREHFHELCHITVHVKARGKIWTCDGFVLPAFCGLSDYSRQVTRSTPKIDSGMIVLEIVDGRLVEIHTFFETLDLRTKRTVL